MPIRVVIAEDHTLLREGTRNFLALSGDIEVVGEAGDGDTAVKMASALRPDVVLMDIGLPVLDGVQATRLIKTAHREIAVLALTAYDDEPYVLSLLEAGASGYLLKNCRMEELLAAIRSVYAGQTVFAAEVARKLMERPAPLPVYDARVPHADPLTSREQQVLRLAAGGLTNKEIAGRMLLSPRTVQMHLVHIFEKLGVSSRTEAVMTGLKRGWLQLEEIS